MKYVVLALLLTGCASSYDVRISELREQQRINQERLEELSRRAQELRYMCERLPDKPKPPDTKPEHTVSYGPGFSL